MKAMFDGEPEKLALFPQHGEGSPGSLSSSLPIGGFNGEHHDCQPSGEATEWVTKLDEDMPELGNISVFQEELRARFKDESQALQAEAEIWDLRQRG